MNKYDELLQDKLLIELQNPINYFDDIHSNSFTKESKQSLMNYLDDYGFNDLIEWLKFNKESVPYSKELLVSYVYDFLDIKFVSGTYSKGNVLGIKFKTGVKF